MKYYRLGYKFLSIVIGKKVIVLDVSFIVGKYLNIKYWFKYHKPLMRLNPFPIYYIEDSRDCDHVRSCSSSKAKNGWNYVARRNSAYENAEGPTSIYRISKKEYKTFTSYTRDYIAEAHEDGHPYSVGY